MGGRSRVNSEEGLAERGGGLRPRTWRAPYRIYILRRGVRGARGCTVQWYIVKVICGRRRVWRSDAHVGGLRCANASADDPAVQRGREGHKEFPGLGIRSIAYPYDYDYSSVGNMFTR